MTETAECGLFHTKSPLKTRGFLPNDSRSFPDFVFIDRPRGRSGIGSARRAGSLRADELLVGLKRLRRRLWHGAGHMGRTHHE